MDASFRLDFLRRMQRLLDEGDFTATYKFALLRALADLSVELGPEPDGGRTLAVGQLADKFIEYYWPQARPYRHGVLRQSNEGQAVVVRAVAEYHTLAQTPAELRLQERAWTRLHRRVADNIERYPLRRLQRLPAGVVDFLYSQPPPRQGRTAASAVTIRLRPGVADAFREFHSFVLSLVELGWIRQITAISANRDQLGDVADLSEFLFGSERESLRAFLPVLQDVQEGDCFYCGKSLGRSAALDHFIAWSRYPVDLGHNLVAACPPCNTRKSDHLASEELLARWRAQNIDRGPMLDEEFTRRRLPHDRQRTLLVAAWAYERAEALKTSTWVRGREFQPLGPGWRAVLRVPSAWPRAAETPLEWPRA